MGAAGVITVVSGGAGGTERRVGDGGGLQVQGVAANGARLVEPVCRRRQSGRFGLSVVAAALLSASDAARGGGWILEIRQAHPIWGADRIRYQLDRCWSASRACPRRCRPRSWLDGVLEARLEGEKCSRTTVTSTDGRRRSGNRRLTSAGRRADVVVVVMAGSLGPVLLH